MKNIGARSRLYASCMALAPGFVSAASAQSAPPSAPANHRAVRAGKTAQVEEVIVTAQKRKQRLSDVPVTVTALSATQLQQQGITRPADLDKVVPGLTFTESQTGSPVYTIRGIGFYSLAIGVSPTVSIYQNQVPLPFSRMTEGAALDIARVEVLQGPQGTLFGENSTAGAINYIPAPPTKELKAGVDVTYGRFNEADVNGFVSGTLSDTVKARLSFDTEHRDGWQYNYVAPTDGNDRQNGQRNFTTGRLLIDWQPSSTVKWEINLNGWADRSDTQARQKIAYSPTLPNGYPGYPGYPNVQADLAAYPNTPNNDRAAGFFPGNSLRRDDTFYQLSATGEWRITPQVTLTSITSAARVNVIDPSDYGSVSDVPEAYITERGDAATASQELRLAGDQFLDGKLRWLAGVNYEYDSTKDDEVNFIIGSNSGLGPFRFDSSEVSVDQTVNTFAGFGGLDYNILSNLTAQLSGRYTSVDNSFTGCLRDTGEPNSTAQGFGFLATELSGSPTTIPLGGCETLGSNLKPELVHQSLDQSNFSYRAGLSWKLQPSILLYANITQGYKSGAFEVLPAILAQQEVPATQESVLAYEVGTKLFLFDRRLEADGSLFYEDYKNKQIAGYVEFPIFGSLSTLLSIPRSHVQGGELSLAARPIEGLTTSFGASYVETRVDSDFMTLGAASQSQFDIKGEPFPNAPKWQVNADAQYDMPLTDTLNGFIGGSVHHESATPGAFAGGPLFRINDYVLLGLRAGVQTEDGRWRLWLWGKNITNQYYWTTVAHTYDTTTRLAGMPATYGITLSYRY